MNFILSLSLGLIAIFSHVAIAADNTISNDTITSISSEAVPLLIKSSGKWSLYTIMQNNKKVCYVVSKPTESSGNHSDSRAPYLMVSVFPGNRIEVSTSAGYQYKPNSIVSVSIDGTQFRFLAEQENLAWPEKYGSDQEVLTQILKGFKILIFSESYAGTYAVDGYSLEGFKQMHEEMRKTCPQQ